MHRNRQIIALVVSMSVIWLPLTTPAGAHTSARRASAPTNKEIPTGHDAPNRPIYLTGTAGDQQVLLSWAASTDPDSGVAGCRIYRNGVQVGQTSGTTYTDSGPSNGTTNSYDVTAYDPAGNVSAP
jgi:hypothetical protein